jgi:hypothetical protein
MALAKQIVAGVDRDQKEKIEYLKDKDKQRN